MLEKAELAPGPAVVSRQTLLAAGLLFAALALTTRFWGLGDRPFHHDESIHAHQSYTLMKDGNWRYDPAYHGPFLYYANALVYRLLGVTNTTARLLPAIFGILLIAAAFPLARWIGRGRRGGLRRPRPDLAAPDLLLPVHPGGPLLARVHVRDDPRVPGVSWRPIAPAG